MAEAEGRQEVVGPASLTFSRLRSPLPPFSVYSFFTSPSFRCWLLSPRIREFHAEHSARISVAGTDGESDGSEQGELTTGEQAVTEANSQSTDVTHVHTHAEDWAWARTRRRQLRHDCLAAGFCKMSSYELIGLDFGACEVIKAISSLFLSSETEPEDLTAWKAEVNQALTHHNVDFCKLVKDWVIFHLKKQGSVPYSPYVLPKSLQIIYDLDDPVNNGDIPGTAEHESMRKAVHEARFALAVHSKYYGEANASGEDGYLMFNSGFLDDPPTARDRCHTSAQTRYGIGMAGIGWFEFAENTLKDAIRHQDERKKEAMQEEGEDLYRQDQFTNWYHLALVRMRATMTHEDAMKHEEAKKHEAAFEEALKKATDLATEAEEARSNGKLMKIQLDYLRAEWLVDRTKNWVHDMKEYDRQMDICKDLYRSIRDRARDLGLKDEHRWMVDINQRLAILETHAVEGYKEASVIIKPMLAFLDGNMAHDVQFVVASFVYAWCLESLKQDYDARMWREKSFAAYKQLVKYDWQVRRDFKIKPAVVEHFEWHHVDDLIRYGHLDSLDMEYGLISSE